MAEVDPAPKSGTSAAGAVAVGIFASRIMGFFREAVKAYFFGVGAHSDVFTMALRGPNLLQNLLGEGTISAAFIPIYSRLVEAGKEREAGRFAGAIFGLLLAVASGLVLLGMLLAPYLVALLAPGFVGDAPGQLPAGLDWITAQIARLTNEPMEASPVNRYALAVASVRIVFPMAGVLVLSAWALGVLNSHRRFFLPYVAPVLWNVAIIAALFIAGYVYVGDATVVDPETLSVETLNSLLFAAFLGALVGGVLQFGVQLPLVFREMKHFRPSFSTKVPGVREAVGAFGPVVAGRGVAQISSYLDMFLASLLATGSLAAISFAQTLYLLPVSLFGLSVAASELPELARISREQLHAFLGRVERSVRQVLFLTIPTVVGYLGLGFLLVGAFFRRGNFGLAGTWLVYLLLGGYSLGMLATTVSRLLQNSFYALHDTRTPAKIAVMRVVISTVIAIPLMYWLDRFSVADVLGLAPQETPLFLGALGLSVGASVGAWVELWRLQHALKHQIERFGLPLGAAAKMTGLAGVALAPALLLWWLLPDWPPLVTAVFVTGLYAAAYLGLAFLTRAPELDAWLGRFLRK